MPWARCALLLPFCSSTLSFCKSPLFTPKTQANSHSILECHSKTLIIFGGFAVSTVGWFVWLIILSQLYPKHVGPYVARDSLLHNFGGQLSWWVGVLLCLAALVVIELAVQSIRRVYFPNDVDYMQRIEKDAFKERRRRLKHGGSGAEGELEKAEGWEMQDVSGSAHAEHDDGLGRRSNGAVDPTARDVDQQKAQSMAWTGNAEYYYNQVDPQPRVPQPTHQQTY